jgi:hypothetical protein
MQYTKEYFIGEQDINGLLPEVVCYAYNISLGFNIFKQLLKPQIGVVRGAVGYFNFYPFGKRGLPLSSFFPIKNNYNKGDLKIFSSLDECVDAYNIEKAEYVRHIELIINKQRELINKL